MCGGAGGIDCLLIFSKERFRENREVLTRSSFVGFRSRFVAQSGYCLPGVSSIWTLNLNSYDVVFELTPFILVTESRIRPIHCDWIVSSRTVGGLKWAVVERAIYGIQSGLPLLTGKPEINR